MGIDVEYLISPPAQRIYRNDRVNAPARAQEHERARLALVRRPWGLNEKRAAASR